MSQIVYRCEECYKSEKNCKCDKESECENCGKSYNDSELLDGEMSIGETVCPHCKACVHTTTRYLDDDTDIIICCACGVDCDEATI